MDHWALWISFYVSKTCRKSVKWFWKKKEIKEITSLIPVHKSPVTMKTKIAAQGSTTMPRMVRRAKTAGSLSWPPKNKAWKWQCVNSHSQKTFNRKNIPRTFEYKITSKNVVHMQPKKKKKISSFTYQLCIFLCSVFHRKIKMKTFVQENYGNEHAKSIFDNINQHIYYT